MSTSEHFITYSSIWLEISWIPVLFGVESLVKSWDFTLDGLAEAPFEASIVLQEANFDSSAPTFLNRSETMLSTEMRVDGEKSGFGISFVEALIELESSGAIFFVVPL